jgi:hypothetical protein
MISQTNILHPLLVCSYLANNTRPDISFAVSQVARFKNRPKKSHASAVQMILRYLKRTADKGLVVKSDGTYDLKIRVDADFAGLHGRESDEFPNSARSRLGYIMTLGCIPLTWRTTIITAIGQSTLEAEYAALISAVRTAIPIRNLVIHLLPFFELPSPSNPVLTCTTIKVHISWPPVKEIQQEQTAFVEVALLLVSSASSDCKS